MIIINRCSIVMGKKAWFSRNEFNLKTVSWGLLGPRATWTADIFVIGWRYLLVIFLILHNIEGFLPYKLRLLGFKLEKYFGVFKNPKVRVTLVLR